MNKNIRSGVKVEIALLSSLKNNSSVSSALVSNERAEQSKRLSFFPRMRRSIKKRTRPIGEWFTRGLTSIFDPFACRIRNFLVEGFQSQVRAETQSATEDAVRQLRQEIQISSDEMVRQLRQELQTSSADVTRQMSQELQDLLNTMALNIQRQTSVLSPKMDQITQYSAASARRVAINCGAGEILVRTEVGFLLCSSSDHALLACLMDTGDLERGTRIFIQGYLRPGDTFVDVGANIGMHTLGAAQAMQGVGKIIAFEPFEQTMRMLEKSIWMNGFSDIAQLHRAAVSNKKGTQKLFLGATSGHHSLFALEYADEQNAVEVPLIRLDDVMEPSQKINLLKIDAEGAEIEVVEGGTRTLESNPDIAMIVEFGLSHLRRTGRTPRQWLDCFTMQGFDFWVINAEHGGLEKYAIEELEKFESINLFFARPGSKAWERMS